MASVKVDSDSLEPPGPAPRQPTPCVHNPHGTSRVLFPSLHTRRPRFAEVKGVFKVMSSPQLSPHLAWPCLSTAPAPEPAGSSWVEGVLPSPGVGEVVPGNRSVPSRHGTRQPAAQRAVTREGAGWHQLRPACHLLA